MKVDLSKFAKGAVQEKFDYEYKKVFENIQDINTPSKAKRKLTIELEFSPLENRETIGVKVFTKTKLVERSEAATIIAVGTDNNGRIISEEIGNQLAGQMQVDEETGEIIDNKKYLRIIGED